MPALPGLFLGHRPGNIVNTPQPHSTPSRSRRTRNISAETWKSEKNRIYRLYITDDQTLKEVMSYYDRQYGFKATKKQWKAQLAKWQFRKRLNPQDAAYIASQLRAAERPGMQRRVLFNGQPKTLNDIRAYIRKSDKIHSEDSLMRHLDRSTVPPHITVEYVVAAEEEPDPEPDQTPRDVPFEEPPHDEAVPPQTSPEMDENEQLSDDSFEHLGNPELDELDLNLFDDAVLDGDVAMDMDMDMDINDAGAPEEQSSFFDSDSSFEVPIVYSDLVEASAAAQVHFGRSSRLNSILSNSPVQTNLKPVELNAKLDEWLEGGKNTLLGETSESQHRVATFLSHCCAAAVHSGQQGDGFPDYCAAAIRRAAGAFHDILAEHPWDSLSILNNMFVLLSLYGHHYVNVEILRVLRNDVHDAVGRDGESPRFMPVLLSVLDFMSQIPYCPETQPEYDLDELADMVRLAEQSFEPETHDQFKLSARYMYAWALLEMRQYREALVILKDLKDDCEEVFGFAQFQTINCIATLARAQAMVGKKNLAASTYRDLVVARIRRFFSPKHPQYWDAEYRLACYDRRWIDDLKDVQQRRASWLDIARRMQEPLKWREQFLGRLCPITLQNYRAVLSVLKKLDMADNNTTLEEVLVMQLAA